MAAKLVTVLLLLGSLPLCLAQLTGSTSCTCFNGGQVDPLVTAYCACSCPSGGYLPPDCRYTATDNEFNKLILYFGNTTTFSREVKEVAIRTNLGLTSEDTDIFMGQRLPVLEAEDATGNTIVALFHFKQPHITPFLNAVLVTRPTPAWVTQIELKDAKLASTTTAPAGPFADLGATIYSGPAEVSGKQITVEVYIGQISYLLSLIILLVVIFIVEGILSQCVLRTTDEDIASLEDKKAAEEFGSLSGSGMRRDSAVPTRRRDKWGRKMTGDETSGASRDLDVDSGDGGAHDDGGVVATEHDEAMASNPLALRTESPHEDAEGGHAIEDSSQN